MQIQAKLPVFEDFSGVLSEAEVMTSPAEVHGVLAGLICIGQRLDGQYWFDAVLKLLGAPANFSFIQRGMIIELYDNLCRQLAKPDSNKSFYLLLPSEERPLLERAAALSQWCEGFLYGLGLGGDSIVDKATVDVHEALGCMNELAKLDFDKIEIKEKSGEMDKFAYQGIVEYVCTAVIAMYKQFAKKPTHLH